MQENLTLGDRLKIARKRADINKSTLGSMVGTSGTSINNIETGVTKSPSSNLLAKIASALKVDLHWLLTGEGAEQEQGYSGNIFKGIKNSGVAFGANSSASVGTADLSKEECLKELEVLKAKYEGVVNENALLKQMIAMLQKP